MKNIAILSFLLSFFLISCGDDSGSSASESSEESELSSSSSSKANKSDKSSSSSSKKAKVSSSSNYKSSSNSSEKSETVSTINKTISGMAQGPFEKGATVSVYELDTNFQQTEVHYETKIKNDSGSYSIKLKDFKSQYALFKVDGRYINNVTGKKSADSITLYAFTDLDNHDKVNINFLTHLSHKRILYLANKKDIPVTNAKKQAEKEVLRAFDIEYDGFDDAENIDFFEKDKQSAALLAISILMQDPFLDTNINNSLTDLMSDIEKNGIWTREGFKTKIAIWASKLSQDIAFDKIKGFIMKWNKTVDFPAIKKYVENFWQQWQQGYNLESIDFSETNIKCELDTSNWKDTTEGTFRKGDITDIIYIFDNKKWRVATLPEASLGGCNEKSVSFFGYAEERQGQDSSGYYICLKSTNKFYWERIRVRYFEDYVDSIYYDYICNDSSYYANSKAGDAHWGNIVQKNCINCKQENFDYWEKICKKRCYVLDGANPFYQKEQKRNNGWREGDFSECALGLGGCTESRIGTIKEGPAIIKSHTNGFSIDSTQKGTYVCWYNYDYDGLQWHEAVDLENNFYYDIFPAECTFDLEGQIISGKKNKYVCDDEKLRIATQEEIDAGFACTSYLRYQKKCGIEEKE
ncbi:hypothetical protein IKQ19_16070 [Candidatus Saccharibacteria bacterium]|nr:hypothetical protein [Candidatus Saccharibacteria bacterium]